MDKEIRLEDCTQINSRQYSELPGTPTFKAQTPVDDKGMYWMVFESNNVLYSIHNKLVMTDEDYERQYLEEYGLPDPPEPYYE